MAPENGEDAETIRNERALNMETTAGWGHNIGLDELARSDQEHHIHPWEHMGSWREAGRFVVTHAEGIYLFDADGRRLIDGPAGMWAVQIGYGRQEMADAIAAQVMELPYASPWTVTTSPSARLAQ